MSTEDQGCGRAVRGKSVYKFPGDGASIIFARHTGFLGERIFLQPVEQSESQTSQHAYLRIVNVRVHQSGQDKSAAQVAHSCIRILLAQTCVVATSHNSAVCDHQAAIGVRLQSALRDKWIAGRMKKSRAQKLLRSGGIHSLLTPATESVGEC